MEKNNLTQAIGIIPVRYDSTRLPGKPLIDICGKSLLQRTWEGVSQSNTLQKIIVAIDDERIAELCLNIGAEYIMTPSSLPSGTDRVAYAYNAMEEDFDIILNIQGDEPFLTGDLIDKLVCSFAESESDVATLVKKIQTFEELEDPNIVKVVLDSDNNAMYFSRSPIPYIRDIEKKDWLTNLTFWKHIGVYAYRKNSLFKFIVLPVSNYEKAERLEQMRLLETGAKYLCVQTDADLIGVDTPEDLEKVRSILEIK